MTFRAAVIGASGYTGVELLRLLHGHPEIEVGTVTADSNAGARVADLYPSLAAGYGDTVYAPTDPSALAGYDVVFLGLPHGQSQQMAGALVDTVGHVVDLGADFRLPRPTTSAGTARPTPPPSSIGRFAFGMPELYRDEIVAAQHVASPGCYPTAAVARPGAAASPTGSSNPPASW